MLSVWSKYKITVEEKYIKDNPLNEVRDIYFYGRVFFFLLGSEWTKMKLWKL